MARAEFEYDEVGNTFFYVLISFYAIILVPCTYFFFPFGTKKEERKIDEKQCQCIGCVKKRERIEANRPWKTTRNGLKIAALVTAWIVFFLIARKVSSIETTHNEYDPYTILGLDAGADASQIRRKYHDLSKKHHPDRGGDALKFDEIAKAYQALTDEEARQNWEKYGNPDGPTATTFGIALPKWLVSKEYGLWVLAFYGIILMVILPSVVGIWWYNSIKYNKDKVLLDTTQLFFYFLHRTPKMEINRMLMVLTGAFEFWRQYNKEIIERESDDITLPRLMKHFPNLGENKKERPLCLPYALKARILAYAYLSRHDLENNDLRIDQTYIISRVLRLIEEMLSCTQQLAFYSQTRMQFETVENVLKLMPMFTQGLWPKNSPLLQLPHINDYNLGFIKRNKVHSCAQLARLDDAKRRLILNSLNDSQYRDVLVVLSSMPQLHIEPTFEVQGEDDKHEITAGCFITLKVKLTRHSLLDKEFIPDDDNRAKHNDEQSDASGAEDIAEEIDEECDLKETNEDKKPKRKAWEKQPKKAKGKSGKKTQKQKPKAKTTTTSSAPVAPPSPENTPSEHSPQKQQKHKEKESDSNEEWNSDDSDSETGMPNQSNEDSDVEDEDWGRPEKTAFETKSQETHLVHAPFYPQDKYEWWWVSLALADKKMKRLVAVVKPCKTLVDTQTVELRFTAPPDAGMYNFVLGIHSDSYLDADYSVDLKLDVKEAKAAPPPSPDTDDDEEESNSSSEEEYVEEDDSD